MTKNLDIVDRQMELGMVKTITTGSTLNYLELLFNPNVKAQFYYNENDNVIQFCVKDTDLGLNEFNCILDKETIRSLIVNLRNLYNQLKS